MRKVWRQFRREQFDVAGCTVERPMRWMGIAGAVHGASEVAVRGGRVQDTDGGRHVGRASD